MSGAIARRVDPRYDLDFRVICSQHGVSFVDLIGEVAAMPCACSTCKPIDLPCMPCRCAAVIRDLGNRVDRICELAVGLHEARR